MAASKIRAERDLCEALQSLQNALSKNARAEIEQITFPRFETTNAVDMNAAELQDAVEKLIELRGIKRGSDMVKEYVRKWYRASYPFARMFLSVAKEGAAMPLLNPFGLVCGGLLVLMEVAYDMSGKGDEVDEMMKELSIPLRRIQLEKDIRKHLDSEQMSELHVPALNLLVAVLNCLTADIHHFTDSKLGKVLKTISPRKDALYDLRMKLKAATDRYTEAMVDLGVATTVQLSEAVEIGFEKLEAQFRRGAGLSAVDPFETWLLHSVEANGKEKNKYLSMQESTSPSWIFELPEFSEWLNNRHDKRLWLSGTTGFGKSVVSAYLSREIPRRNNSQVMYFFCKENPLLNNVDQIIPTIIYQLISVLPSVQTSVKTIWDTDRSFSDGTAQLKEYVTVLLVGALNTLSGQAIYFLLDGINECPKASLPGILSLLKYLQAVPDLHVLVTSQPTEDIVSELGDWPRVELQSDFHEKTIESFVQSQLTPKLEGWFKKVGTDPIRFFNDGKTSHRGMFIWVATMLRYMRDAYSFEDFQRVLENVPDTINELYRGGLDRLAATHTETQCVWIRELFSWVALPPQDISIAQLSEGISYSGRIRLGRNSVTSDDVDIEKIVTACGAFVRAYTDPATKTKMVGIVHNSFAAFLNSRKDCGDRFYLDPYQTRFLRATACLSYLSNTSISRLDHLNPTERTLEWDKTYPLFRFACESWSSMLQFLDAVNDSYHHSIEEMTTAVLDLTRALIDFTARDNLKRWLTSVLIYYGGNVGYVFGSLFAKPFRRVMAWLDNHEEIFRLKLRSSAKLEFIPYSRRHITKYLNLSRSQLAASPALNHSDHKQKVSASLLPKPKSWRHAFRAPNSSRFQTWVAKIIADVWLTVDPVHVSESRTAFIELAVLYEIHRRELSPDDYDIICLWTEIDYEKLRRLLEFFEKGETDFVKSVTSWALSTADVVLKDNANVNMAHAYRWYGTREPETTKDIRISIAYYRTALTAEANNSESTAAIVSSLSITHLELFSQTLETKDLSESIVYGQRALDLTPPENPQSPMYIRALCEALTTRAGLENSIEDLNKCIEYAHKGLVVNGKNIGVQAGLFCVLVEGLLARYWQTGSEDDLQESILLLGQSLRVTFSNEKESPPHETLDSLRRFYLDEETTISLPSIIELDPFEPFLETIKKQLLFANDIQRLINAVNTPDLSGQIDMVEAIVLSIGFFYRSRKQYDTALRYFQSLLETVQVASELMAKVGTLSDQLASWAWLLICIGDTLYMQGKLEDAEGHYRQAVEGLGVTKNRLEKKELLARLLNKGWDFRDSHFMEFYT